MDARPVRADLAFALAACVVHLVTAIGDFAELLAPLPSAAPSDFGGDVDSAASVESGTAPPNKSSSPSSWKPNS